MDPLERDRRLEEIAALDSGKRKEERKGQLRDIEVLKRQCKELSAATRVLQAQLEGVRAARKTFVSGTAQRMKREVAQMMLLNWRVAVLSQREHNASRRAMKAEEQHKTLLKEAAVREAAAATRLAKVEATAEKRVEEAESAVRNMAQATRAGAFRRATALVDAEDWRRLSAAIQAWRVATLEEHLTASMEAEVERRVAAEVKETAERHAQRATAQRLTQAKEAVAMGDALLLRGRRELLASSDRAIAHTIMAAWRTHVRHRLAMGALQETLFAEEASRGAALGTQKRELNARHAETEARHRDIVRKLRAELTAAEARHADAVAAAEAESAQRIASAEADFADALRQGGAQETEDGEGRLEDVVRSLRARADARLADEQANHAEAILAERERSMALLVEADRRHEEALMYQQQTAEQAALQQRRRHMQAMQALEEAAEQRVLEAESRQMSMLAVLQEEQVDKLAQLLTGHDKDEDSECKDSNEECANLSWESWQCD